MEGSARPRGEGRRQAGSVSGSASLFAARSAKFAVFSGFLRVIRIPPSPLECPVPGSPRSSSIVPNPWKSRGFFVSLPPASLRSRLLVLRSRSVRMSSAVSGNPLPRCKRGCKRRCKRVSRWLEDRPQVGAQADDERFQVLPGNVSERVRLCCSGDRQLPYRPGELGRRRVGVEPERQSWVRVPGEFLQLLLPDTVRCQGRDEGVTEGVKVGLFVAVWTVDDVEHDPRAVQGGFQKPGEFFGGDSAAGVNSVSFGVEPRHRVEQVNPNWHPLLHGQPPHEPAGIGKEERRSLMGQPAFRRRPGGSVLQVSRNLPPRFHHRPFHQHRIDCPRGCGTGFGGKLCFGRPICHPGFDFLTVTVRAP